MQVHAQQATMVGGPSHLQGWRCSQRLHLEGLVVAKHILQHRRPTVMTGVASMECTGRLSGGAQRSHPCVSIGVGPEAPTLLLCNAGGGGGAVHAYHRRLQEVTASKAAAKNTCLMYNHGRHQA